MALKHLQKWPDLTVHLTLRFAPKTPMKQAFFGKKQVKKGYLT